jgi:hypothetical protein
MQTDFSEFTKLSKIFIPKQDQVDYYLSVLKQSPKYQDVESLFEGFSMFSDRVMTAGYSSTSKYKMKCLDLLVSYITSTKTYSEFQAAPQHALYYKTDELIKSIGPDKFYLSLDIQNANYSIMKSFDQTNELGVDWKELTTKLNIDPYLSNFKSFRQLVFGNLNPKRNQKLQIKYINQLLDNTLILKQKVIWISHDELVLLFDNFNDSQTFINNFKPDLKINLQYALYQLNRINNEKYFFKEIFPSSPQYSIDNHYPALFGVPNNQYYFYFKTIVLKQPLDDRDLYFWNDNRLAQWVV